MMMDLPSPVIQKQHREHELVINDQCIAEAQDSMHRARQEARECYDAAPDDVVDEAVSSDGTWQRRGFPSLFGIIFIIEHETKKVLDYEVMSKLRAACKKWENCDHDGDPDDVLHLALKSFDNKNPIRSHLLIYSAICILLLQL